MRRLVAIATCIAILYTVAVGVHTAFRANEREHCLHAMLIVSGLVEDFVRTTKGDWPRSWHDLEMQTPSQLRGSIFRWPQDAQRIREYVSVDFNADPVVLATLSPSEFSAITPVGECVSTADRGFPFIIEALQSFHSPASVDADRRDVEDSRQAIP